MLKLLLEAIGLFLTAIYINCRGVSETNAVLTGEMFSYSYPVDSGTIKITSVGYRHSTKYQHWYIRDRVRYTYLVKVTKIANGEEENIETYPMPLTCWSFFTNTTFPHREAVKKSLYKHLDS